MAQLLPYHASFQNLLLQQPPKGRGHHWLYRVALHIRHYHTEEACFRFLRACANEWKDRHVPDAEIRKAVRKAYSALSDDLSDKNLSWPDSSRTAIANIIASTLSLFPLQPIDITAQSLLLTLFDSAELICAGYSQHNGITDTLQNLLPNLDRYQYIVSSPMSGHTACNQEGRETFRSLANTGLRRFLVIENDTFTKEEQARLLSHLATLLPLVLVVDSGGKSLHGWFAVAGLPDSVTRLFMEYAVYLGADPHSWVRCQWVRMPGGLRYGQGHSPIRQSVLYVHPTILAEASA